MLLKPSLFCDESGSSALNDRYHLLTLVAHNQNDSIMRRATNATEHPTPVTPRTDYRLTQAADYICTMEFTALKYAVGETTSTDERFFGS